MMRKFANQNVYKRWRRHKRVRNRVIGTPERPRVCVFRSNTHIYAQLIDDTSGRTLLAVSSLKLAAPAASAPAAEAKPKVEGKAKKGKKAEAEAAAAAPAGGRKTAQAREVGRLLAEAAKSRGVSKVAFDRGGYLYHGRVAALAEGAREAGLEF